VSAWITFVGADGSRARVAATRRGDRWFAARRLLAGESAFVAAGDVVDLYGNVNGADSASVSG
jgi:hypothetical protein